MFFGPVRKDDARHNVKPSGLNMRPLLDFKSLTPSDALAVSAIIGETKRMATFHEAHQRRRRGRNKCYWLYPTIFTACADLYFRAQKESYGWASHLQIGEHGRE